MSILQSVPVLHRGVSLDQASIAVILLHGRGADAHDIISLASEIDVPETAFVAPDARGGSWYPASFLAPIEQNEPYLSEALQTVSDIVAELNSLGFEDRRIVLGGFSQGACLSLEYAARHPRRWGAALGLSGGVIGPQVEAARYIGDFDRTPVYLGCSDVDPFIPADRVRETAALFERLNASVTTELFSERPHAVYPEEIHAVRRILTGLL